ncbi:Ferrodoxin-fold anticodon-binding domain [Trinorchestia longiramus]|nr:Ferrodoxin-fold anticodon-binding domain [Trinorchestia longiramus]
MPNNSAWPEWDIEAIPRVLKKMPKREYATDHMTNINTRILGHVDRALHRQQGHPLRHTKERLLQVLYKRYRNRRGNPVFAVIEDLPPVVTVRQNFDELLVPPDHVCRRRGDNYYINSGHLLRAHTSAHQSELLTSGLDNFVVVGDVYRRDQVDAFHYPVFHQMEGVKLYSAEELLLEGTGTGAGGPEILTGAPSTDACSPHTVVHQAAHTQQAVAALTTDLHTCLQAMATELFGQSECRPWQLSCLVRVCSADGCLLTSPSHSRPGSWRCCLTTAGLKCWDVASCSSVFSRLVRAGWVQGGGRLGAGWGQVRCRLGAGRGQGGGKLGTGRARVGASWVQAGARVGATGVEGKVGWAFGLGLERWAMKLYDIPDIRLFWSTDSGFLSQFSFDDPNTPVKYKRVSVFPQCTNDISFWLPTDTPYDSNDFYDLVRQIGGDIVEQVGLVDNFKHPKTGRQSHCYRIVYRHMEKTLTQDEVNVVHRAIERAAAHTFSITIR